MNESINAPLAKGKVKSEWVWCSKATAIVEGEAFCYDWNWRHDDDSDASVARAQRYNYVEVPSTTNAQHFAGVAARAYQANTGGQLVELYKPGSVCKVYSGASTTIGVSFITFDVTTSYVGQFRYEGLPGIGSAIPLQTVNRASEAGTCLAYLMPGPEQSGGVEVVQAVDQTAFVAMVGGTTLVIGAVLTNADATEEVLDGTIEGLKKKFEVITTAATTNQIHIDILNNDGILLAGTAMASIEISSVGAQFVIQWTAGAWRTMGGTGITEA